MKYGFWQNLNYLSNYSRAVACLHADLKQVPTAVLPNDYRFRNICQNDESDLRLWAEIVTDAYNDKIYNLDDAKKHFSNHLFLNIKGAYFLEYKNVPIATISVGTYKDNERIGGDARTAVTQAHQKKGLGELLIQYGFNQLFINGIQYGESVISAKRTPSIALHYKCGFYPPPRGYTIFNKQRRFFFIHLFIKLKLRRHYKSYLKKLSSGFRNVK